MANSIVQLTTGPPGTGKSYARVSLFLITEFLPDRSGRFFTNVNLGRVPADHPFKPEPWEDAQGRTRPHMSFIRRICNEAAKRYGGSPNDYCKRVRRIPPVLCAQWRKAKAKGGPWDFFRKIDMTASHIQLDEIHNYCPKNGERDRPTAWMDWLGEIRHAGCTVEFMTQFVHEMNPKLLNKCAFRRTLTDTSDLRDPFLRIPVADWLEVRALWTGKYDKATAVTEKVRLDETFRITHQFKFRFKGEYFAFYNSHEKPQKGGKGGKEDQRQFEKRSKPGVLWWFYKRHPWPLTSRALVAAAAVWLLLLGGGKQIFGWYLEYGITAMAGEQNVSPSQPIEQVHEQDEEPEALTLAPPASASPSGDASSAQVLAAVSPQREPTEDDISEIKALREQLAALEASREEYIQQAEELASKRRAGMAVVMITHDEVTFRNGYSYRVGEVIDYGDYEGSTVTAINYSRRAVTIDENIILRMGRDDTVLDDGVSGEADSETDGDRPPALREPVRRDGPQPAAS